MEETKLPRPLGDRVLVLRDETEKEKNGVVIPDTAQSAPPTGVIMAAGSGRDGKEMSVKVGDKVMFHPKAGWAIEIEGVSYLAMRETDIIFVL